MGPTASGKTELACALAEVFPLDLISVDSAQVYRGLDIGSAKPDVDTLRRHPHRLIDICDPGEAYSAARFRRDALAAMDEIGARGRVPLLVGGTGLYFRVLQRGLSALPPANPALRKALIDEAEQIGWPAMHARLAERDPRAAARIRPGDAQRIQRALEVIELTGVALSSQQGLRAARLPWRVLKIALVPGDRERLHARIAKRFDAMLDAGLLDEVRALHARGDLGHELPAVRAVGYRQAWQVIRGEIAVHALRDRGIFATRQLARRQLTWLRGEIDARVLDPDQSGCFDTARHALAGFLGTAFAGC
ncbi:MAG: tRNA (adenosine(37)-N6)-dimethylallyltransferase MiaA [Rhodanobacteraceae bacterium]